MKTDPRIDTYIESRQEFAKPILTHLHAILHEACPIAREKAEMGLAELHAGPRNVLPAGVIVGANSM